MHIIIALPQDPGQLKAAGVLAVIIGTSQHPYEESHRPCLMRVTCCKHYLYGIHLLHKLITTALIGSSNLLAIYELKQLNLLTLQETDLNMFLHLLTTVGYERDVLLLRGNGKKVV